MKSANTLVVALLLGFADAALGQCTVSVTPLSFGTYYPISNSQSSADISVTCTLGEMPQVRLDAGINATFFPRKMSNAISTLDYNLFTDPAFTQVWGDGTAGTFTMMSNGNDILRVYGQIAAGQNVADGVYSDAVTVLIMW